MAKTLRLGAHECPVGLLLFLHRLHLRLTPTKTIAGKAIIAGDEGHTRNASAEPLTLGALALGAPGLNLWRRDEEDGQHEQGSEPTEWALNPTAPRLRNRSRSCCHMCHPRAGRSRLHASRPAHSQQLLFSTSTMTESNDFQITSYDYSDAGEVQVFPMQGKRIVPAATATCGPRSYSMAAAALPAGAVIGQGKPFQARANCMAFLFVWRQRSLVSIKQTAISALLSTSMERTLRLGANHCGQIYF